MMPTYGRLPVTFERGEGVWLWDTEGNKYLDGLGGIAVCVLGHSHPRVTEAISSQAGQLIHTSNLYGIAAQQLLAERLTSLSGMRNVFFGNSGAEANEAALKIARLYGHNRGIEAAEIIVTEGSFHGRTLGTLSATGSAKVHAGFAPLVSGFVRVPFGDLQAIRELVDTRPNVVAILIEPIQGEGGIVIPPDDYLTGIRTLCDENEWLMMLDEVQTGMGRTGEWFAWQHADTCPDVMTLAKGLANGVPIGACLARGIAAETLAPGNHGSTFGGSPLACTVADTVLRVLEEDGYVDNAARMGARIVDQMRERLSDDDRVVDIRGKGLMIGIEMSVACGELVSMAMERGLLINVTAERVVRLLPPLNISEDEVDELVERLCGAIRAFHNR
jgi:acetylornithine/N-succinyldiaminopimelate aminotransferase